MKRFLAFAVLLTCTVVSSHAQSSNVITNDTFWKSTSGNYIYSQGGGTDAVTGPAFSDGTAAYYSLDGTPLSHPNKGVNIVRRISGGKAKTCKVLK